MCFITVIWSIYFATIYYRGP